MREAAAAFGRSDFETAKRALDHLDPEGACLTVEDGALWVRSRAFRLQHLVDGAILNKHLGPP